MRKVKLILCLAVFFPVMAWAQLNVRLDNAYSREMPPTAENIAAYLTIRNVGSHGVSLESVSSDIAETVMIHRSTMADGMMVMEHVPELYIGSRESVNLEPGGLHIMLMGLRRPLRAGDEFRMNLSFSNGVVLRVDVPVLEN
jgi:copper(I)-binding protein